MSKYKFEIAVAITGGIISIIELFLDMKLGFFIIAITIILEVTLVGIRSYIKDCLKEYSEFHELVGNIENVYWKQMAEKELIKTKDLLKQMINGKRDLNAQEITYEELRLIKNSKKYISCIYFADNITKLKMRLNSGLKYSPMTAVNTAYRDNLNSKVKKRRVFILDKLDVNDPNIKEIIEQINNYYSSKEIGFEVRYIYYSKLREMGIPYNGNMILIDDEECTLCFDRTEYPNNYISEDQNIIRVVMGCHIINRKLLEDYKHDFDKIWEMAISYSDLEKAE